MTTVKGWKPLAVVTKKSILVSKCVLDLPLLEIEMSKLNKIILLNILLQLERPKNECTRKVWIAALN